MRTDGCVHRCPGCGQWLYGRRACTVCAIVDPHPGDFDGVAVSAYDVGLPDEDDAP